MKNPKSKWTLAVILVEEIQDKDRSKKVRHEFEVFEHEEIEEWAHRMYNALCRAGEMILAMLEGGFGAI